MLERSFLDSDSISNKKKTYKALEHNQLQSLRITSLTIFLLICIEFAYLITNSYHNGKLVWPLFTKMMLNILFVIGLIVVHLSMAKKPSKIKNYLVYILIWLIIVNEVILGFLETKDYENLKDKIVILLAILALKIIFLQIMTLSLSIHIILKLVPAILLIMLNLVCIALNLIKLRYFLVIILCISSFVLLVSQLLKRVECLFFAIANGAEELDVYKNIVKSIPIGIMLTDKHYNMIYQNSQIMSYFDSLPSDLRNPKDLFRQFKGGQVPEEGLLTVIRDAINPKIEGLASNTSTDLDICLDDALDILFKNYKIVENILKGGNTTETEPQENSISSMKFYMRNSDITIEARVVPISIHFRECVLLLFQEKFNPSIPSLGADEGVAQSLLLSSLSHELRTPLNSALALIETSVQEPTTPQDLKERLLTPALNSIKILSYTVKDIIDYSKIASGSLGLRLETCNIASILESTVKLIEMQAAKKKINIMTKIAPNIPTEWCTDPDRFSQVVLNLLTNGLKYTMKGSIIVSLKYLERRSLIEVKVKDSGIGIEKEELGKLQRTFRDQQTSCSKLTLHSIGIGLGLSVSNQICCILGAKGDHLKIKSAANKGSEFKFYIDDKLKITIPSYENPGAIETHDSMILDFSNNKFRRASKKMTTNNYSTRKQSIFSPTRSQKIDKQFPSKEANNLDNEGEDLLDASSDSSPSLNANTSLLSLHYSSFESTKKRSGSPHLSHKEPSSPQMPTEVKLFQNQLNSNSKIKQILIVDDDSFNILSLELIFKNMNINHDHAYNGKEAVEKMMTGSYDLIMMDCNMPVMDGWEASRQILKLASDGIVNQPVIVACTAFEDAENLAKCSEAGMKYIIQKPVNADKLRDLLKKLSI